MGGSGLVVMNLRLVVENFMKAWRALPFVILKLTSALVRSVDMHQMS